MNGFAACFEQPRDGVLRQPVDLQVRNELAQCTGDGDVAAGVAEPDRRGDEERPGAAVGAPGVVVARPGRAAEGLLGLTLPGSAHGVEDGASLPGELNQDRTSVVRVGAGHGRKRTRSRTFLVGPVTARAAAGRPLKLTVKLPAAALVARSHDSVTFMLTARNAHGSSVARARIPRLTLV